MKVRKGDGEKSVDDKSKPATENERGGSTTSKKNDGAESSDRQSLNVDKAQGGGAKQRDDTAANEKQHRDKTDKRSDDSGDKDGSHGESKRQVTHQQKADTHDKQRSQRDEDKGNETDEPGGRRSHEFSQQADGQPETPPATPPATTGPNVSIGDVPSLADAEVIVEANPDVIASVSTSGGFAFARSGDVAVVSGPDGPTIIRTGAGEPPADGGEPDGGFMS